MKRSLVILIVLLGVVGFKAGAQEKGRVNVIKDPLIDSLIEKRLELASASKAGSATSGYRVQIFSGLEREMAYTEQSRFKAAFPNVRTYISYVQPNYRLRVGDFRTRLEAEKFMNDLRRRYSSMFIFSEKINL